MKLIHGIAVAASWLALLPATRAADKLELKDGDRVVLLGNTLIEREQRSGYWELALTVANPDKNVTFRNLGWSGDTVWGEARARFGGPTDGFRHLKEHVLALKPTVIVLGYGQNEAFAGPEGVASFQKGLDALLEALAPAKARIVILAPMSQEKLAPPLPDPTAQNKNLELYRGVLEQTAAKRGLAFVDLFRQGGKSPLTDNGIHLTDQGYWTTGLSLDSAAPVLVHDAKGATSLTWQSAGQRLPVAPSPLDARQGGTVQVQVAGLPPGKYTLQVDETKVSGSDADWAKGSAVSIKADVEQVEKLRAAIIEKNKLYFHRWRPQNETYLFLFRKNEQGQNAKEIPEFDPLIEKLEAEIAKLRVPATRTFKLAAEKGGE